MKKRGVKIRDAVEADCEQLAEIERSGTVRWGAQSLKNSLAEPDRILVAESEEGRALGFIVGIHAPGELQIANIVVIPSARRTGIGSLLLKALTAEAMQRIDSTMCYLEVAAGNDAAVEFFNSLGFDATGRRHGFYNDGRDALVMSAAVRALAT